MGRHRSRRRIQTRGRRSDHQLVLALRLLFVALAMSLVMSGIVLRILTRSKGKTFLRGPNRKSGARQLRSFD